MINFHLSDAVKWAEEYSGPLYHALFTDAPYHLQSIVKRFGGKKAAAAKPGRDGAFARASRGFMGQSWDGGDVAFRVETWKAFLRVLYPGAFGLAFGSPRNVHRMAVAIEDAGFVIHPTIFGWAYGSGLPKGAKRVNDPRFDGHRYGTQALKPALEPIIVFQKPYDDSPQKNIIETGAGTLNIDGTRIPTNGEKVIINRYNGLRPFGGGDGAYETESTDLGRWASNFILLDPEAAAALECQFAGSSRYFLTVQEQIDSADPIRYAKKANRKEKDAGLDRFPYVVVDGETQKYKNPHPTVKSLELTRYLAKLLLPPAVYLPRRLFVPFSGVGSECIGAMQAGWDEIDGVEITPEYIPVADARAHYWGSIIEKEAARQVELL